ncbi:hypothetical protein RchiOBHm_Chr6g0256441 [Rosa chinensis]|uniref:Uncharacterized protein n=1 Tax=Rosa chinensis TaxID=74649 RepID=A0A2P6PM46_ROSCH|nr:hypothetical protein RchiOBHm_Chr6g0256441 [Rosa chinensis]
MKGLWRFRGELRTDREDVHMNIKVALEVSAGVCKNWREIMKEIVKSLEVSGKLTFPISLKQLNVWITVAKKFDMPDNDVMQSAY